MKPEYNDRILINGRPYRLVSESAIDGSFRFAPEGFNDNYMIVDPLNLVFDGIPAFKIVERKKDVG